MYFRSMETDLDKKSFQVKDFQKLSFSDTKSRFCLAAWKLCTFISFFDVRLLFRLLIGQHFYIIRVTSAVLLCNVFVSTLHCFLHFHIDRDINLVENLFEKVLLYVWHFEEKTNTTSSHFDLIWEKMRSYVLYSDSPRRVWGMFQLPNQWGSLDLD